MMRASSSPSLGSEGTEFPLLLLAIPNTRTNNQFLYVYSITLNHEISATRCLHLSLSRSGTVFISKTIEDGALKFTPTDEEHLSVCLSRDIHCFPVAAPKSTAEGCDYTSWGLTHIHRGRVCVIKAHHQWTEMTNEPIKSLLGQKNLRQAKLNHTKAQSRILFSPVLFHFNIHLRISYSHIHHALLYCSYYWLSSCCHSKHFSFC